MLKEETLQFIKDVAQNNNRDWFTANKHLYEAAKEDLIGLITTLLPQLLTIDSELPTDIDPKKCLMRIYRDVRFSKNKAPYKTNFGIWFSTLKGNSGPGYYLHIQPNESFLAGGYWMPEAADLKLIRQEMDYNMAEFKAIVEKKAFTQLVTLDKSNALKKAPKGYDANDPNINYLKLTSFVAVMNLDDEEFLKPTLVDKLISSFKIVKPLVVFLRQAIKQ